MHHAPCAPCPIELWSVPCLLTLLLINKSPLNSITLDTTNKYKDEAGTGTGVWYLWEGGTRPRTFYKLLVLLFFAWELCDRPGIDSAVGWQLSALLWEHSPSRGIKALNSQRHFNLHISQPDLDVTPNTGSNVALTIFDNNKNPQTKRIKSGWEGQLFNAFNKCSLKAFQFVQLYQFWMSVCMSLCAFIPADQF